MREVIFHVCLLADSGYDRGNEEIAIFKIRMGNSYKSLERINLFLIWLFCRIIGLYGKRWMVETVFSVIKRIFGDRMKSRSPHSKFVENHLIPVAISGDSLFLTLLPLLILQQSIVFSIMPLFEPLKTIPSTQSVTRQFRTVVLD